MEEIFDSILEAKLNRKYKRSKEMYKSLSEQKRVEFLDYLYDMYFYDSMHYNQQKLLAQTIKFYSNER
jgi:hypothetical protein